MPRWYAWIAAAFAVRAIWENVSAPLAGTAAVVALIGYWGFRVATSAYDVPVNRRHAAWREVRRIAVEVGDAILGWALIIGVILGIVAIIATWPPNWGLVLVVCGLAIVALVALGASIYGAGSVVRGFRARKWQAIQDELEHVSRAWQSHLLSVQPTDRAAVERVVASVYARNRRSKAPVLQWAGSPPEFVRLLATAVESRRLHGPPPWWISFSWYATAWWPLWDEDYEAVRNEVGAAAAAGAGVEGMEELVANASWFSFRKDAAIVLEHPTEVHVDADGELHNATGPVIRFADGWTAYALEGVVVPAEAIEDPEGFDPRDALTHENVEVRRVLLAHLGWDRVVRASGLTPHAEDAYGRLWRLWTGDEALYLLEVENATPDSDGTHRSYFLRVPPDMRSPREATAWSFGLTEREYAPDAES